MFALVVGLYVTEVQCRHLKRLVSVHGRYSYLRMASFVLYFLYKNMTFTACQVPALVPRLCFFGTVCFYAGV